MRSVFYLRRLGIANRGLANYQLIWQLDIFKQVMGKFGPLVYHE